MPDVKCPMCSKPNPESAEECGFCGARLKPLVVDQGSSESLEPNQPQAGDAGEGDAVPGWLSRIRERAEEEEIVPDEPPAEESDTDWLSRLRSVETDESGPPEDLPDWLEEDSGLAEDEQDDDWLGRLREKSAAESEETEALDEPSLELDESNDQPVEASEPEFDPEQQLRSIFEQEESPGEPEQTSHTEEPADDLESVDWLAGEPDEQEGSGGDEDFPSFFEEPAAAEPGIEEQPESELPGEGLEQSGDIPDWFDEFEQAAEDEERELEPTSSASESEEEGLEAFEADELPDWLGEDEVDQADRFEPEPAGQDEPESEFGQPSEEQPDVDWQEFDWGTLEGEEEIQDEPIPAGLGAPPEEKEEGLPHVPALIIGEDDDEGGASPTSDEFDLDAIELPDWLSEVDQDSPAEPEVEKSGDLAPATIPNWLEAMRPVETFKPVVDIEPEEERAVESVGPLAGLRGVLLAEPVVAKPRTATSVGERLHVTERQYAQADILSRIVEREDQERVGARDIPRGLPIVRWLISLVLVVSVLLPPIFGIPSFETPQRVSRDLGPLLEVVNGVESGQPALVVFDYEPGYSAELEAVASTMLHSLMARGVHIVTLSTRPTGPPLALNLVEEVGQPHQLENGRDYIHLGFLSGGPTAVQLFSIAPKSAILKGFMLPADLDLESGWDAPILRNVDRLSDFGMVAVITAGTDNARTWAEQAQPWLGETPMVMVLSAGAEPMVRPYFESLNPSVDGILTGLPAAVAYEQINDRPGQAQARWDTFGSGVLAVELILAIGLVYGIVDWILDRRREADQE